MMIYLTSYYTHTVKKASIFLNFITLCNYLLIVKGQNSCTFYCSFGNYSPGPGSCLPAPGSAPVFQRLHLFHFICLASSVSLHLSLSVLLLLLQLPDFINHAMHPDRERAVTIDPTLLVEDEDKTYEINTPAEKLEHSKILWGILCLAFLVYIIYYFVTNGFTLGLNIVNMIFMFLGILLHGDLRRYVDAVAEAAGSASGVLLQFPFYAGIMGMMVVQNEAGVSLAGVISQFFVNISNNVTFPMLSFLAAGIVNFFVPSGGGQWAVQGPIMMPAGAELGIGAGRTAMAIAWGDQWTNMIQPFWALPALGIAKLSARDIMGYLVVVLLFVGLVACLGFLAWGLLF